MAVVETEPTAQRAPASGSSPWAKQRILETADRLFSDEGIHTVGIDRLISESGVTKATFYKHYGAKDTLIVEYVKHRHENVKSDIEPVLADRSDDPEGGDPRTLLHDRARHPARGLPRLPVRQRRGRIPRPAASRARRGRRTPRLVHRDTRAVAQAVASSRCRETLPTTS